MALQITTPIQLKNGLTLPTSYARVGINEAISGKEINAHLIFFVDKNSYLAKNEPIRGVDMNIDDFIIFNYNREVDGSDTLEIAHNVFISTLASQGITAIKDLD